MNFICNGNKYAYGKGYIYLPVVINGLPEKISVENIELTRKSSFHSSLVCVKDIIKQYGNTVEDLENNIIEAFCEFVSKQDVSLIKFVDEFRLGEDGEKRSLAVMCEVSNMEMLFSCLQKKLNIEIPTQPTHITLYTLQQDVGIGFPSKGVLGQKSKVVDGPSSVKQILV